MTDHQAEGSKDMYIKRHV